MSMYDVSEPVALQKSLNAFEKSKPASIVDDSLVIYCKCMKRVVDVSKTYSASIIRGSFFFQLSCLPFPRVSENTCWHLYLIFLTI